MKKFLYIIGFVMFSSALFSPLLSNTALGADGSAANTTPGECKFPYIRCEHDILNIPDVDWGVTFGEDLSGEVGQDLYKNVLEMVRVAPAKKAFKNAANAFGVTESETVQLLRGDFGPIVAKNPYLTQEDAVHKMAEFQDRYNDEKDIFDLQANVEAAVTPNEIFVNGDVNDSGFDLINDLNNIENLLFKKIDPIDVGGNFSFGSSGGSGGPAAAKDAGGPAGVGAGGNPDSAVASSDSSGTGDVGAGSAASGLNPKPTTAQNPNICFINNKIENALQTFANKKVSDANLKETPTTPPKVDGLATGPTNGATNDAGAGGVATPNAGAGFAQTTAPTPPAKPAPASNWLKKLPCNDVLCVQVNFVMKTATAYVDSDNCIACHVEKITAKLKETVNHSLIPSKATGNLLEPGVCKQAAASLFSTVNMHAYTISKPIETPPNDDLIYGTNAVDEWDRFVNTTKPFPFYEKQIPDPNDPTQDPFIPTVEDRAAKAAGAYAADGTKQEAVNNAIQQEIQQTQQVADEAAAIQDQAVQNDADIGFYQSIRRELEQMNYYFTAYKKILQSINEDVKGEPKVDHACQIIKDIKQCT